MQKKKKTLSLSPWILKIEAEWVTEEHFAFNKLMIKPNKAQWVIGENAEFARKMGH